MNLIVCSVLILNLSSGIIEERLSYFRDCSRAAVYFEKAQQNAPNWLVLGINYMGELDE